MIPKCSLNGFNPLLQLLGLLFMAIILVAVVFYYLQISHSNILEKYQSGAIDVSTIDYKNEEDPGDRSTFPQDKYPGAKTELVGDQSADATKPDTTTDIYKFRECKVYFTNDVNGCDTQADTPTKTCSYKFDGWLEFDTYTDINGATLTYPKKKYDPNASNTNELINSHITSKCFKEFDYNGKGSAKRFEYKENKVVKYDSKGSRDNTEIDTNIFGGKKYTSIQFMNNTDSARDNLANVIDSICSLKYTPIRDLTGKTFYKFVLDANNNLETIRKLSLNADQSSFDTFTVNGTAAVAINDFAILGSHGLRFDDYNRLQVFINKAAVSTQMNIYKFNYVSNICANSQIKNYTKHSQNIKVTDFVTLGNPIDNNDGTPSLTEVVVSNINNLNLVKNRSDYRGTDANGNYLDYKKNIMDGLETDKQKAIKDLNDDSIQRKKNYTASITDIDNKTADAYNKRSNFTNDNKTFLNIIALQNNNTRVFDYANGYVNTRLDSASVPSTAFSPQFTRGGPSSHEQVRNSSDKIMIFTTANTGHTFTVPSGGMNCDILMIGGGGNGVFYGGAGGAGACIVAVNQSLPAGTCTVTVGGPAQHSTISAGGDNTRYLAAAGGSGGNLYTYEWGDMYRNSGGSGGCAGGGTGPGGGGGATTNSKVAGAQVSSGTSGSNWICRGNIGGRARRDIQYNNDCAGGGGIGTAGKSWSSHTVDGLGDGGNGLYGDNINSQFYNFRDYFANGGNGFGVLHTDGNYYIGGGGGGYINYYSRDRNNLLRPKGGAGGGGRPRAYHNGGYEEAISGTDNTGSGGGRIGGSGIVIIRYRASSTSSSSARITAPDITTTMDAYYKNTPSADIVMPASKIQVGVITSFVYLQKGFYRFRADIGNQGNKNPNIMYAELVIYDENNRGSDKYNCKKVFKYTMYNNIYEPSYLRQYIEIPTNKFYKLAYTYYYNNQTQGDITDNLNTYYTYLSTAPQRLENDAPSNLIAFYRFNSSLNDNNPDTSVSKFNLVDTYGRYPYYQTDPSNGRKYMNTNNGSVKTQNIINLAKRSFSISLWYRAKNSNYNYMVGHGKITASTYQHLYIYGGYGYYGLDFWGTHFSVSGYSADVNNWVHLAFVIDVPMNSTSCNRKMYRNGVLIHQDTPNQLYNGVGILYVGEVACYGEGNYKSNADISDFMLYDKSLSAEEVTGLYNSTPTTASSSSSGAYVPPTVLLSNTSNDDNLFTRSSLSSINTSLTAYLFSGSSIYNDYRNTNLIRIFSTISYTNNSYRNYENLINYLGTDNIDFFNVRSLSIRKREVQANIDGESKVLTDNIRDSVTIGQLNELTATLKAINYNTMLPIGPPVLKSEISFTTIFGKNETTYITDDKIADINNFANVQLKKAIYVEALN